MIETTSPAVQAFLTQHPIPQFIDGKWVPGSTGETWNVINPATGQPLAEVALSAAADVDAACQAAGKAFPAWSNLPANERAVLLHRWADLMEKEAANLAQLESLDVGKAITGAESFDIPFGIEGVRYFADLSVQAVYETPLANKNMEARTHRVPYGVCGFIFPWNFPYNLFLWGIMPALAAGNTIVAKPSEVTPLSSLYLAKLAQEAGIPDGVINIIFGLGSVGSQLVEHPLLRRMSFTGSPEIGKIVGEACGRRVLPVKLELGGKGAAVVFDDVDLDAAATQLAGAITFNTGQVCCTATRWIVHDGVYDDFVGKVSDVLVKTKIGPSLDRETEMGPLVSDSHQQRVLSYFDKGKSEGATVVLDGGQTQIAGYEKGYYVSPYLLAGDPGNVCFREEIFGPAAYLTKFSEEAEAVEQVNSLHYGLANSVWSQDLARANRVAEKMVAGNSWINAHNVFAYGLPYAGINLSGMGGGVNCPKAFYDYLRDQTIARPL